MISVEIPNGTCCELLEDAEMLALPKQAFTLRNKWSASTIDVHFSKVPGAGGQHIPAVIMRRQKDGRGVAFKITELIEAAERLMEKHTTGRIIR